MGPQGRDGRRSAKIKRLRCGVVGAFEPERRPEPGAAQKQEESAMTTKVIGYWVATAIIEFELLVGGITDLAHGRALLVAGPPVADVLANLGYPAYLLAVLGTWKLLGGTALVVPGFPRLKEWAYAGVFFEMTGAAASWIAIGDNTGQFITPLIFAVFAMASWALRPPARILGTLSPGKMEAADT
jgi:uncharacterized membrane protein YphA (DoxX/SURF4 family)